MVGGVQEKPLTVVGGAQEKPFKWHVVKENRYKYINLLFQDFRFAQGWSRSKNPALPLSFLLFTFTVTLPIIF